MTVDLVAQLYKFALSVSLPIITASQSVCGKIVFLDKKSGTKRRYLNVMKETELGKVLFERQTHRN